MTPIIDFPRRWERDNVNRGHLGTANGGELRRPSQPADTPLEQNNHECQKYSQARVVGEQGHKIVDLVKLRRHSVLNAVRGRIFQESPLGSLKVGEACFTSDYTGTAEAAILHLPVIWLVREGRHYRSFRCCGPDGTGKLIKEWNVVEEAVGMKAKGSLLWRPIHRFVSNLTNPEVRLKEIDAQLRILVSRNWRSR